MKKALVILFALCACTSQESQNSHGQMVRTPAPTETTTLDIVFLPDALSEVTAWQNVEQHLANVAPYVIPEGRRVNILNEIIIRPTESAFNAAQKLPPRSLRQQCRLLTREWAVDEANCHSDRLAAYTVAALDQYEEDLPRDIMAQELAMRYGLGNGLRHTLGEPTEFSPEANRSLVLRLAAW